ncbi:hypothetical protein P8C59_003091 [Phyllachora maydis]|uniref:Uncharacterized protein n=1 Tax=Phyllachora maydis TaxID=1825666 RepID=A0AAD9I0R7_9PEZI|nr:hypothetical protein P8C59_003091 [Phyllachora maydis]
MYMYIAFLPYCYYCYNLLFTNLLIANIDSLSDLDNSVYNIPAPAPILAKPAKITLAIYCAAACKAKRRKSAKAYAIVGRAAAAKRYKKRKEAAANAQATNKDDNNGYNRVYIPLANTEEEKKGSSSDNDSVNSGTSNSANKGKGSGVYKCGEDALRCKDTLLYKQ